METLWDKFWQLKGEKMEWNQEDILKSKGMKELSAALLADLNKNNFEGVKLLELGSGMGITSMFFAHNGAKVTLLDVSPEVENLIKKYWKNYGKYAFICADLFTYKTKNKYDVVTSFGLCEHFVSKQRQDVLKKHIEFLDDRGIAIISVPYKYGLFYRLTKLLAEITGFWSFGLEVPFSKKELIDFAKKENLDCEILMSGFYSSAYDLFVRKPLKVFRISVRRRFDETKSLFDSLFGSGLLIILKKDTKR